MPDPPETSTAAQVATVPPSTLTDPAASQTLLTVQLLREEVDASRPDVEEVQAGEAAAIEKNEGDEEGQAADDEESKAAEKEEKGPDGLTAAERSIVQQMRARDQEVRRHEEAHARVGGQYASAPRYSYEMGPDNRQYAISGEVSIDANPIPGKPEATIRKMEIVKRAARAPADPSAQDHQVAAKADQHISAARAEIQRNALEERREASQERNERRLERLREARQQADRAENQVDSSAGEESQFALATPAASRAASQALQQAAVLGGQTSGGQTTASVSNSSPQTLAVSVSGQVVDQAA